MLAGDVDTGKAVLHDYVKSTIGFEKLGEATGSSAKSLIRMFGPRGIRRRGTCSASSAICSSRPVCNFTWPLSRADQSQASIGDPDDDLSRIRLAGPGMR